MCWVVLRSTPFPLIYSWMFHSVCPAPLVVCCCWAIPSTILLSSFTPYCLLCLSVMDGFSGFCKLGPPQEWGGCGSGVGSVRYTWQVTGLSWSQTSLLLHWYPHLCQSASSLHVAGHCLLQVWSYLWFQEARLAQPVGGILCPLGQCLSLAFGKFWMVLTQD